jgi:translation initiation factor 2B subunit (eIF-2B alpha/beta/delta family)
VLGYLNMRMMKKQMCLMGGQSTVSRHQRSRATHDVLRNARSRDRRAMRVLVLDTREREREGLALVLGLERVGIGDSME